MRPEEVAFFRDADPWGFILFARNIDTPDQVRALTSALRDTVGRDAPILIDQEGGRVQRLRPPHWRNWEPPLDTCDNTRDAERAMWLRGCLIAAELRDVGIDVNCAPMLDIATAQSHEIILNRCYGGSATSAAARGRAMLDGMAAGGVAGIIKHIPGHGRASLDSHFDLPRIAAPLPELQKTDFAAFRALNDAAMAMTAHIVFEALDTDLPVTLSPAGIAAIRSDIGFDGLLMSDDVSMQALSGSHAERTWAALEAGCDIVLHCNGIMDQMTEVAGHARPLTGKAADRAHLAEAARGQPQPADLDAMAAEYAQLFT